MQVDKEVENICNSGDPSSTVFIPLYISVQKVPKLPTLNLGKIWIYYSFNVLDMFGGIVIAAFLSI